MIRYQVEAFEPGKSECPGSMYTWHTLKDAVNDIEYVLARSDIHKNVVLHIKQDNRVIRSIALASWAEAQEKFRPLMVFL